MFDNNILISWNQSINEWINQLNIFIDKTEYSGLYILGEQWIDLVKELENIKTIKIVNINDYLQFIKFIDYTENVIVVLNKIINGIIVKSVIDHALSNTSISFKEDYQTIIKKIHNKKKESDEYLKIITDSITEYISVILESNNPDDLINQYESSLPHSNTSMEIHMYILKKYKKINLLEPYKKMVLGIKKGEYPINLNTHAIQRLNYLIEPFINSSETKKGIDISISNQVIEYDVMPLISKISATKFGPIDFVTTGINKSLINRFKTIKIYSNILNTISPIDTTTKPLTIYNGNSFKQVRPVNFKEGYEWNPMGVDHKTYKYNELLEKVILQNMKIDNTIYKSFKMKDYQPIVSIDILKNSNRSVSDICYEELQNLLNKKLTDKFDVITREMYLLQYFNINKIIESLRRDTDSIEIIPITKLVAVFKLI